MAGVFAGIGEAWGLAVASTLAGAGIVIVSKKTLQLARFFEKLEKNVDNTVWKQTAAKAGKIAMLIISLSLATAGSVLILGGSAVQIAIGINFFDPVFLAISGPVIAFGAYEFVGATHVIAESIRDIGKMIFAPKPKTA